MGPPPHHPGNPHVSGSRLPQSVTHPLSIPNPWSHFCLMFDEIPRKKPQGKRGKNPTPPIRFWGKFFFVHKQPPVLVFPSLFKNPLFPFLLGFCLNVPRLQCTGSGEPWLKGGRYSNFKKRGSKAKLGRSAQTLFPTNQNRSIMHNILQANLKLKIFFKIGSRC